jgi:TldD protein
MPENSNMMIPEKFGISNEQLKQLLSLGLSKGGDFSELYFEYSISNSVVMSEDIIKNSSESISLGVGVRVLNGAQTGYGYTNELTFEKIKEAMLTAAAIVNSNAKQQIAPLMVKNPSVQVYDMNNSFVDQSIKTKIDLVSRAYKAALNHDSKIKKVSASLADEMQYVTIANSDGLVISDTRPQVRLVVSATAEDKGIRNTGRGNDGGRVGMDFYAKVSTPEKIGEDAAKEALELLKAKDAPAGQMQVVLSKDQSGVMIHEAVGHPLEGDANWKKTSIMWDKVNQMVANPLVTIYDDGTIPDYRGSLNIDDEGMNSENAMLIEKGKLVGFLHDRLSAQQLKMKRNGHARRESYRHMPIPRMNNTILAGGDKDPEEIISSVKKGFYAVTYQGGMVNGTGQFTFSVNLGYMIENGKLTHPLKNATLIGSNIEILNNIDMIGNDMGFFLGTCGKDGQSVPVTCGTPSLRISEMTVGGIA